MTIKHLTAFPPQFVDQNGEPVVGGAIYSYLAGTLTPEPMYINVAGTSAGTSITLNALGVPEVSGATVSVWLDSDKSYKFTLKDAAGASVWTVDNISADQDDGISLPALTLAAGQNQLRIDGEDSDAPTSIYRYVPTILYRNFVKSLVENTVTETTITTYTVPAKTFSVEKEPGSGTYFHDRSLRITASGLILNNSGGLAQVDIQLKLGGTKVFLAQLLTLADSANKRPWSMNVEISARDNSSVLQVSTGTLSVSDPFVPNTFAATDQEYVVTQVIDDLAVNTFDFDQDLELTVLHDIADPLITTSQSSFDVILY